MITFVNISNHPMAQWGVAQKAAAGVGIDDNEVAEIPFPNVDPEWDHAEVGMVAEGIVRRIAEVMPPDEECPGMIHIMGEMTMMFAIVQAIREVPGWFAVASTTQRVAVENPDGTKTTRFEFVKFRPFAPCRFRGRDIIAPRQTDEEERRANVADHGRGSGKMSQV